MTRNHPLSRFMPYGAPELLVSAEPRLTRAVLASSFAMILAFALALILVPHGIQPPARIVGPTVILDIPPEIPAYVPPKPKEQPLAPAKPTTSDFGKIEPTVEEKPIDWQDSPPATRSQISGEGTGEGPVEIPPGAWVASEEALPVRGVPVHVDQLPVAIVEFKPEYPSFARDAGVEGIVVVHALVGKDGRVLRVEVDERRSILLLNETALEAARRCVFRSAMVDGHAVPAWVAITYKFTLH